MVDQSQAIKFAVDIARGTEYLHSLEPLIPRLYLTSTHIMVRPLACTLAVNIWDRLLKAG